MEVVKTSYREPNVLGKFPVFRAKELAKTLLWKILPGLYRRVTEPFDGQVFSIGLLQVGSPFQLQNQLVGSAPILTTADIHDVPAEFVADPFILKANDRCYIFFEVFNRNRFLGEIGVASSTDGSRWQYHRTVLSESHHLAYPQVFREGDDYYMIPDSPGAGVKLYRAHRFPDEWQLEKVLLDDKRVTDPTVFRHEGHWWMISGFISNQSTVTSSRLHFADQLSGPWHEHPCSPIISNDPGKARPAGAVIRYQDRLFRFTQDCTRVYGESVSATEILELTPQSFRETERCKVMEPSGDSWCAQGIHHATFVELDGGKWIAAVDGWRWASAKIKSRLIARAIRKSGWAALATLLLVLLVDA